MKTYNVREISELLDTNQETVRRWIRSGKLEAEKESRKTGNVVSEEALYRFLKSTTKYAGIAAGMAIANPIVGIPSVVGAVSAGFVSSLINSDKRKKSAAISRSDVENFLEIEIRKCKKQINAKQDTINQLKEELLMEQNKLEEYEFALNQLNELNDSLEK